MKIFIVCSKHFYDKLERIATFLKNKGHKITYPNSFDEPMMEEKMKKMSKEEHKIWKRKMMLKDKENIEPQDAILVLNFNKIITLGTSNKSNKFFSSDLLAKEKNLSTRSRQLVENQEFSTRTIKNYIGGATFLEIYKAFELDKKIFFFNPLPNCSFTDELTAIDPIIINGNLEMIK